MKKGRYDLRVKFEGIKIIDQEFNSWREFQKAIKEANRKLR